jgi:hypothetical protein
MGLSVYNVLDELDVLIDEAGGKEELDAINEKAEETKKKHKMSDTPSEYWGDYIKLLSKFKLMQKEIAGRTKYYWKEKGRLLVSAFAIGDKIVTRFGGKGVVVGVNFSKESFYATGLSLDKKEANAPIEWVTCEIEYEVERAKEIREFAAWDLAFEGEKEAKR